MSGEGGPPEVTLETSMGSFTLEMYYKHAPRTCRNFIELSRRGYYNNVKFHRIIKDFIVQGGDPTGTGRGGESIYGPKFDDEINTQLKHTGAGIISMANAGPNTNGSQFFITLAPAQSLDGKHTIFGRAFIIYHQQTALMMTEMYQNHIMNIHQNKKHVAAGLQIGFEATSFCFVVLFRDDKGDYTEECHTPHDVNESSSPACDTDCCIIAEKKGGEQSLSRSESVKTAWQSMKTV